MDSDVLVAIIALIGTVFTAAIAAWASLRNKSVSHGKGQNVQVNHEGKNTSQQDIYRELTSASLNDVSWRMGEMIHGLPVKACPEGKLFFFVEQIFRRPAFYNHPERHWPGGLYAIIVSRLIWEQEVMPRISASKYNSADKVLSSLMEIESFVGKAVGLMPDELTALTQKCIQDKELFLDNWHLHPKISIEDYEKRSRLLQELQNDLKELGLNVSGIGSSTVFNGSE